MDTTAFDDLSRVLGAGITRQGFFRLVVALGVTGIAASPSAAKKGKHHKRRRRRRRGANDCPADRKNAVCHCPEGLGGSHCKINCVGTGGGHENHKFDCMCAGSIAGVPDCDPDSGRCPEDLDRRDSCGGPTTCAGTCVTASDCPFNSVPGCICNTSTGQCQGPPATCGGACAAQETCTAQGTGCVCRTLPGSCGACVPDGSPAGGPSECCSGQFCPDDNICGQCVPVTCAGPCGDQATCVSLGGNQCVCLGLGGPNPATCGPCIPDTSPASRPDECCSGQYCVREGLCGPCPAQTCAGTCTTTAECRLRGGSTCQCAGGTCLTAVGPITTCPSNYTGNAKSPCDSACPCRGGRRCQNGRCCEQKGTHCRSGKECCSGRCKRIHASHKQCA